jgi:lipid A ethanolaminephosphotransferase
MKKKLTKKIIFIQLIILSSILVFLQSLNNPLFVFQEWISHFDTFDLRGIFKGLVFLGTYLLSILLFWMLINLKSFKLFLFSLFIVFITQSIDLFTQLLGSNNGFTFAYYSLAFNEKQHYEYLSAYADKILLAMFFSLLIVALLYIIREKLSTKFIEKKYFIMMLIVTLYTVYYGAKRIDVFKLMAYPATVKIPLIAFKYHTDGFSRPAIDVKLDKSIQSTHEKPYKNIIWIIDESITGTYLSLNGYEKKTTPYLESLNENSLLMQNFGVVNSVSNCSGESNLYLRAGMNPLFHTDIKKDMYDLPTIYQYAQRAGYQTWLFDAQTKKGFLQDYLTLYDLEDINHFETFDIDTPKLKRDKLVLDAVSKIVNDKKSKVNNFIVIVKYGSHVPYSLAYDKNQTIFKPAMTTSYGRTNLKNRDKLINTYCNAIHFTVDEYLKELVAKIDFSQNIVFYTSDHGQNILETPEKTLITHCNGEYVVKNEVSVPLIIFTKNAKKKFPITKENFYSQFQIFPTTLQLFGYDKSLIQNYGKTLEQSYTKDEKRKFITAYTEEVRTYDSNGSN